MLAAFNNVTPGPVGGQQQRKLSIHEHMSMELLHKAQVAVPRFRVATTANDVYNSAREIGTKRIPSPLSTTSAFMGAESICLFYKC